jgi:hypothetical protein
MFIEFYYMFMCFLLYVLLMCIKGCCQDSEPTRSATNSRERAWNPGKGPDPFWAGRPRFAA